MAVQVTAFPESIDVSPEAEKRLMKWISIEFYLMSKNFIEGAISVKGYNLMSRHVRNLCKIFGIKFPNDFTNY